MLWRRVVCPGFPGCPGNMAKAMGSIETICIIWEDERDVVQRWILVLQGIREHPHAQMPCQYVSTFQNIASLGSSACTVSRWMLFSSPDSMQSRSVRRLRVSSSDVFDQLPAMYVSMTIVWLRWGVDGTKSIRISRFSLKSHTNMMQKESCQLGSRSLEMLTDNSQCGNS